MGLARFFHDEEDMLTKKYDENVLGTADYLAPEQATDSHAVDIRADIYSLGATFYFCLTGRTPFAEGTVAQKLIWHQTRMPKPIRGFRPDVPEGVIAIIDKAMAKDVAQRYQSPAELAEALDPWVQTPIPPPPQIEMPQLSLAAMGPPAADSSTALAKGGDGDAAGSSRKIWQVPGPATPPHADAAFQSQAAPPSATPPRETAASREVHKPVTPTPTKPGAVPNLMAQSPDRAAPSPPVPANRPAPAISRPLANSNGRVRSAPQTGKLPAVTVQDVDAPGSATDTTEERSSALPTPRVEPKKKPAAKPGPPAVPLASPGAYFSKKPLLFWGLAVASTLTAPGSSGCHLAGRVLGPP